MGKTMKTENIRTGDLFEVDTVRWDQDGHVLHFIAFVDVPGEGQVGIGGYVGTDGNMWITDIPSTIRPGHLSLALAWLTMHERWACEQINRIWEKERYFPRLKKEV